MNEGMSLIVKTIARWVVGFIFLYGIYTLAYGHLSPGGGFAGGVILACSYVLILIAYGKKFAFKNLDWRIARSLDSIGGFLFLFLAFLGLLFAVNDSAYFFANFIQKHHPGKPFHLFNGGIIPIGNVVIGIKVLASVFIAVVLLSVLRLFDERGERTFESMEEEK